MILTILAIILLLAIIVPSILLKHNRVSSKNMEGFELFCNATRTLSTLLLSIVLAIIFIFVIQSNRIYEYKRWKDDIMLKETILGTTEAIEEEKQEYNEQITALKEARKSIFTNWFVSDEVEELEEF